jgi:hypothetical protein
MRDFLPALVLALLAPSAPLFAVDGTWNVLGPDGGSVNDLAFQPRSSQVLYAAVLMERACRIRLEMPA